MQEVFYECEVVIYGYSIENYQLANDLTIELKKSSLSRKYDIEKLLFDSANAFEQAFPDYNGCLSKARLTLETIVRNKI